MAVRGYILVLDAVGDAPYSEFNINSTETVNLTLKYVDDDGNALPFDLSGSQFSVFLRASRKNNVLVPINVGMTKRSGDSAAGDTGRMTCEVCFRVADFPTDGELVEMGAYLVDSSVNDAFTISGFKETLWQGLWEVRVRKAINAA